MHSTPLLDQAGAADKIVNEKCGRGLLARGILGEFSIREVKCLLTQSSGVLVVQTIPGVWRVGIRGVGRPGDTRWDTGEVPRH